MKNPLTPAGIEPATFRFAAQHLNHCSTAVPRTVHYHTKSQLYFICLYLLSCKGSLSARRQCKPNVIFSCHFHETQTVENCALFCVITRLRMGPIGCPEKSVRNYHYSLRNTPDECSSQLCRGGSLKSRKYTELLHS